MVFRIGSEQYEFRIPVRQPQELQHNGGDGTLVPISALAVCPNGIATDKSK